MHGQDAAAGSTAGYRVREKLAALPAKSDAVGRSPAVTGTVKVDGSGTALTASDARFEVDLTKLTSDESRRDNRIREIGLETDKYPTATYALTSPISIPAEAGDGKAVTVQSEGDLMLHGVTKKVQIPLQVQRDGAQINIVGNHTFREKDILEAFELKTPNLLSFYKQDDRYSRESLQGDLEKLRSFITANFYVPTGQLLDDTTSFLQHGIIDSTGVLELVAFVDTPSGWSSAKASSASAPGTRGARRDRRADRPRGAGAVPGCDRGHA